MTEVMVDWRGQEFTVGSRVVYPGRQGSSLYMVEATVVELSPFRVQRTGQDGITTLTRTDRVTVVPTGT